MKCFTLCFPTSKYKKLQKSTNKSALKDLIHENGEHSQWDKQEKEVQPLEVPVDLIAESRDEDQNQLNSSSRKKVNFSLNSQIPEEVTTETLVKNKDENKEESEVEEDTFSDSNASGSSFITYPPNHRLDNFTRSSEECEDRKLEGDDLVNDANGGGEGDVNGNGKDDQEGVFQEESSYDSLFSINLDSKKQTFVADLEKEVNSPLKKSVQNVVLNRVDGLIQLKSIKTKSTLLPSVNNQIRNENVIVETRLCNQLSSKENEAAVDASLSSWLLESERTSKSKNDAGSFAADSSDSIKSSNRVKHRPILGEIQLSNCSSPGGSRSYGKNETPKIGTVGSYWKHTGQATSDSASSSSCRGPSITSIKCIDQGEVKCNSTLFENGLERALESDIAEVQPAHPALTV